MTIRFFGTKGEYGCFSNFYKASFKDTKGCQYSYSEQYFMKKKQELFDPHNEELARAIMTSENPKQIKMLGRKVKNFDDKIWKVNRYEVMMSALLLKFSQNDDIRVVLMNTKDEYIQEASPYDYVWGIGKSGKGQNLLGNALMEVRDIIRFVEKNV